jgi:haloalkane dehalogenase
VSDDVVAHAAGLAYREARPEGWSDGGPAALLLHGYPNSSYLFRDVLPSLADAGWRAIAPDLAGYGDSPPDPPGTWERHVGAVERFRLALGLERVALVVHDWGGLIGLRWACDHPEAVSALVLSDTGFFSDGKWHGLAQAMRTEGQGEELMAGMTREGFGAVLSQSSPGLSENAIEEYWKCFADEERRRGQLEMYRSGDFEKLVPYEGRLEALGVPTLVLWAEDDPFAPLAGARRFHERIPDSELVVLEGTGHFLFDDDPVRPGREIARFLGERVAAS